MNKLNAIIIEDEVPAARLLHSMITRLRPQWTLTIIPGSVDEAVAWFKDNPQPDLIFLDIQLADGNAFDFLSAVHPSSIIIFTTAYDQYAIRAFTVNSIDYILKHVCSMPSSNTKLYKTKESPAPKNIWIHCWIPCNIKKDVTVHASLFMEPTVSGLFK